MRTQLRALVVAVSLVVASATSASVSVPVVSAATDFYTPPSSFDPTPGSIIKTKSTPLFLQIPAAPRAFPGSATTVMYTSELQDGSPTAVTGTYIEPFVSWRGKGAQPTVVLAPGTVGQGDQCAPSKLFGLPISVDLSKPSVGLNYEALFANLLLFAGFKVFLTDYVGLGTPGIHTYVNRLEQGHAVLDGARAALTLGKVAPNSPVGFWGYSQGGGASASAAELASTYAPELNVKGSYAGAPPADLQQVLKKIDGTSIVGAIGYTVNSIVARYPDLAPIIDREASAEGKKILQTLSTDCLVDSVLRYGFQYTSKWTTSGQSLSDVVARYPQIQQALDDQLIGRLKPNAPVLVDTGINDDVIPHDQVIEMADRWKAQGADVSIINDATPPILPRLAANHVLPYLLGAFPALKFLYDRFNTSA